MFKKTLLTAAAALAIITGATAISTSDANAGVKLNVTIGHGYYGGYYGGYYPYYGYRHFNYRRHHGRRHLPGSQSPE